jgi:hypothetical protein
VITASCAFTKGTSQPYQEADSSADISWEMHQNRVDKVAKRWLTFSNSHRSRCINIQVYVERAEKHCYSKHSHSHHNKGWKPTSSESHLHMYPKKMFFCVSKTFNVCVKVIHKATVHCWDNAGRWVYLESFSSRAPRSTGDTYIGTYGHPHTYIACNSWAKSSKEKW